jgi:hypothetical protein
MPMRHKATRFPVSSSCLQTSDKALQTIDRPTARSQTHFKNACIYASGNQTHDPITRQYTSPTVLSLSSINLIHENFCRRNIRFISPTERASSHFFSNNLPDALIIQIYSVIKLYMFRASSLPIIRSSLLYIRHEQRTPNDWQKGCPKHAEFYNRTNLDN